MDTDKELYIVKFEENNYSPIIKIITEHNARIKRTYVDSKDVELIICCNTNFVEQLKIKDVEIFPYDLRKKANL